MTLTVAAILAVPALYVGWRMSRAMQIISSKISLRFIPIILLASFYLLPVTAYLQYLLFSVPDLLTYPKPLVYWFWFGLIYCFQLATWFLIFDLLSFIARKVNRWERGNIRVSYGWLSVCMILTLFAWTGIKMIWDTQTVQTKTLTYSTPPKAERLKGLRIIHISDIQGDEFTGRQEIAAYIQKVNALNPDIVIFTGDLISYGTDFVAMAAEELSKVDVSHGLYAVIGDHDYWAGVSNIEAAFDYYDIPLLQDENEIIPFNGDSLLLTGITEVYSRHIAPETLQQLTREAPTVPFKVMASHQATGKVVRIAEEATYNMLLGGHTHGGQLRVPFLGMTFSAAEEETPYISGVYHVGDLFININNGLGFTLAPVRYNAPPSISVIDLR